MKPLIPLGTFFLGVLIAHFLSPEKIRIEYREKESQATNQASLVEAKDSNNTITETNDSRESIRIIYRTIEKPDGTLIKENINETINEQLAQVRFEEKEKYEKIIQEKEQYFNRELSLVKEHVNPKKLNIYGGINPFSSDYGIGGSYNFRGPFTVGTFYSNEVLIPITIGFTF